MRGTALGESSSDDSDEMREAIRLAVVEKRVDDLAEIHSKWYRNPSIVLSFIALLASILSSTYGIYRDKLKDKDERINELQSSLNSAMAQLQTLRHQ